MRGRGYPGTDRLVDALDLRHVERAAGISHQHGAGHFQRRHGLISAFNDGACAAGDDLASLQQALDVRMIFPLLECLKGLEAWVRIVQADHEADIDSILVQVIEKAPAVNAVVERPSRGVLNEAGLHSTRWQLPELLKAQAVSLRRFP